MTVKLNEVALKRLLNSPTGPVGREVALVGELVAVTARRNATFEIIGIRTGRLLGGIQATPRQHNAEAAQVVGTDARSPRGFNYPSFHDIGGIGTARGGRRPWLTEALREVFTI